MASNEPKRTNQDFSTSYTALRENAVRHGIDPNTDQVTAFFEELAEAIAERDAQIRRLYNIINQV